MFLCATPATWLGLSIYAVPASFSHLAQGASLHSLPLESSFVWSIQASIAFGLRTCCCAAMIIQQALEALDDEVDRLPLLE